MEKESSPAKDTGDGADAGAKLSRKPRRERKEEQTTNVETAPDKSDTLTPAGKPRRRRTGDDEENTGDNVPPPKPKTGGGWMDAAAKQSSPTSNKSKNNHFGKFKNIII